MEEENQQDNSGDKHFERCAYPEIGKGQTRDELLKEGVQEKGSSMRERGGKPTFTSGGEYAGAATVSQEEVEGQGVVPSEMTHRHEAAQRDGEALSGTGRRSSQGKKRACHAGRKGAK